MEKTVQIIKAESSAVKFFEREDVQKKFQEVIGNNYRAFLSTVMQIIANDAKLQKCNQQSLCGAALTAAVFNLSVNPNLGHAYIVGYDDYKTGQTYAQFQLGYKGFIQLALRSGMFLNINATDVRQGELIEENRLTGRIKFQWKSREEREPLPFIGYVSYFELKNGFEKQFYMTVAELEKHATKYSKSYVKGFGRWIDDKHAMSIKTVLKLILAKWAPLSLELQKAIMYDQAVILDHDNEDIFYIDNYEAQEVSHEMLQKEFEEKKENLTESKKQAVKRIIDNKEVKSYTKALRILNEQTNGNNSANI
jgi:recombination protein RecT